MQGNDGNIKYKIVSRDDHSGALFFHPDLTQTNSQRTRFNHDSSDKDAIYV